MRMWPRSRTLFAGVGSLCIFLVLTSCGGSERDQRTTATDERRVPSTATSTEDAQWEKYKQDKGGEAQLESSQQGSGKGAHRLLARKDGDKRLINVGEFDGERWVEATEIALPAPSFPFSASERSIQMGDVTNDGRIDYLVPLEAAQGTGVVVSDHGGIWRVLPVRNAGGTAAEPYVGLNPRLDVDGRLVSDEQTCEPSCAEGETRLVKWSYEDGVLFNTAT